jgi:hypothetical protein
VLAVEVVASLLAAGVGLISDRRCQQELTNPPHASDSLMRR